MAESFEASSKMAQRQTQDKVYVATELKQEHRFKDESLDLPTAEQELDSLSEEQMEILLQQALDVNRRLKEYSRKQSAKQRHLDVGHPGSNSSVGNNFLNTNMTSEKLGGSVILPPINAGRQNSVVAQEQIIGSVNHSTNRRKEVRGVKAGNY